MILSFEELADGVATESGHRVVYDVSADRAFFGPAKVEGHALVWTLDGERGAFSAEVSPADGWLMRCDRVDFPPGGVAYRHTHPGPGIRCLLRGELKIEAGGMSRTYGPFEPWFESGPEPIRAEASEAQETSFVRVMLLPREWAGKRTIHYVEPADEGRPKLQRATVYLEEPLVL